MKFTYAILAHAGPDQLLRLIERLLGDPRDTVVLHIDRSSPLWRQRQHFEAHPSERVILVPDPVHVRWAHWTLVAAQHKALAAGIATGADMIHLLSGADWPLCDRAQIERDLAAHAGPLPAFIDMLGQEDEPRMQNFWFDDRRYVNLPSLPRVQANLDHAVRKSSVALSAGLQAAGLSRSRYAGAAWHKGSGWWSLPRDIAVDVSGELQRLLGSGRLRFTKCADEHAVPSILAARYPGRLHSGIRYIDWSKGLSHPKTLTAADRVRIERSGAWFGRKFCLATDPFFLNAF